MYFPTRFEVEKILVSSLKQSIRWGEIENSDEKKLRIKDLKHSQMTPFQLLPGARGGAKCVLTDSEGAVGWSSTSTWVLRCRDLCRLVSLSMVNLWYVDSHGDKTFSRNSRWVYVGSLTTIVSDQQRNHIRILCLFSFVEKMKNLKIALGHTIHNLRIHFRRETSFGEESGVPQSCCQEEAQCQPDQVLWERDNPTIVQVRLFLHQMVFVQSAHNIHITYNAHICSDWMHSSSWSRRRPPAGHSRHCRRTLRFPGLALSPMSFCIL